ncbi:MAG: glycosyltransferase family 4 protein [Candidatus Melainabacteria bacterium]|nr:glycosyltransferase family 4 protein [Candidatus Melainabacteria bacterium]
MKERVLMLAWEYPPRIIGGLARVVWALSKELAAQGLEVHVVTADHPGTAEHELDGLVHVHRVKTQSDTTPDFMTWVSRLNIGLLQYALKLHQEKPFDIVHAHDWMVTDAAWVLKTGLGIPVVSTIHATEAGRMGGIHTDQQRYVNQMEWRLTFESWRCIVNSQHMYWELNKLFNVPFDKIAVIPNGTDPSHFDFEFDAKPARMMYAAEYQKIVLYVGRLVNEKGVQIMLQAAPMVLSHYPGTQFLVVGTGYFMDELRSQANALGISHNVRFLGYVSDDDLLRLYKIADIVCIPSLYEPFGIVALEGMAANVPVVVSDTGGLRDFVENGQTGITTYTGNAQSLAWGLLEVLRNPDLAAHLRKTAYEKVHTVYNWKAIAHATRDVYESVLTEKKQGLLDSAGAAKSTTKDKPKVSV